MHREPRPREIRVEIIGGDTSALAREVEIAELDLLKYRVRGLIAQLNQRREDLVRERDAASEA